MIARIDGFVFSLTDDDGKIWKDFEIRVQERKLHFSRGHSRICYLAYPSTCPLEIGLVASGWIQRFFESLDFDLATETEKLADIIEVNP